ncbi:MAG: TonB-dependent receptor [Bacteroidota bacterium]
MRKHYYARCWILLLFCWGGSVSAQDWLQQRIPADQLPETLTAWVQQLETRYNARILVVSGWEDSLRLMVAPDANVQEILAASLSPAGLQWVPDGQGQVWVVPQVSALALDSSQVVEARFLDESNLGSTPEQESPLTSNSDPTGQRLVVGQRGKASSGTLSLSGYVRDISSGEPLIGATVSIPALQTGTQTDEFGYYAVSVEAGDFEVVVQAYDKESIGQPIRMLSSGTFDVELSPVIRLMDEVVIEAERADNVEGAQMGVSQISIQRLKQMPANFGEVDIVKSALLLPGVQSLGEGASGFQVRGGSVGQNLVLLNQAPVFNSSHLFGFFSAFHPDLISDFDLYKGSIPARFGGRIASVLDINLREGNKKNWEARGGISPVTARFAIEGPIKKNESSFLIGGRTTYSNWILRRLPDPAIRNSRAAFSDLSAKVNYVLNDKNRVSATGYFSRDFFGFNQDTTFSYLNWNGTLNWQHLFSPRLFAMTSVITSQYSYEVSSEDPALGFRLNYGIQYLEGKTDFTYLVNDQHQVRFGANVIQYQVQPGKQVPLGDRSLVNAQTLEDEQALESAVYVSDEWEVSPRWKLYGGLRFSWFGMLGPNLLYRYAPDVPLNASSLLDSAYIAPRNFVQTYAGPEIRLSARYQLDDRSSLKLGFHRMRQYLHLMTNTTAISPFDTWKLSDPYLRPEIGDQLSLGYYRNFRQNTIETSVELYAKNVQNQPDFKDGAQLVMNPLIETVLLNAVGRAYGVELLIRKDKGRLNGWLSYTYSRSLVQAAGQFPEEIINGGKFFPSNVDKPHDLSVVANYRFSRRLSVSSNFNYSTGRPITYPVGQYQVGDINLLNYSDRNQFRIPDYLRLDVSVNFEGNHRIKKLAHSSWSFAVANLLARRNAYSIFFVTEPEGIQGYRLSIFGRPIATLTYNFRI